MATEPEEICGVDDATITPNGLTKDDPCGSILGYCSYADFSQWLSAFKIRLNLAQRNFNYLWTNLQSKNPNKQPDDVLKQEQKDVKKILDDYQLIYDSMRVATAKDLSSDDYESQINEIIVNADDINCLIEKLQGWQKEESLTIIPTGIVKGTRTGPATSGQIIGWGLGALAAAFAIKLIIKA